MTIGSIFRPLLELCREDRVDPTEVIRHAELTAAQLVDPETRLGTTRSRALAKTIFELLGDPEAGLRAAELFELQDADLVGYIARHSANALAALESLPQYARLIGDSAACGVTVAAGRVEIRFGLSGGRVPLPEAVDYAGAVFVRAVRVVTGGSARVLAVRLSRPRPLQLRRYRAAFGSTLSFDSEDSAIVFGETELRQPFSDSNPRLHALLAQRADQVLATLPEAATVEALVRTNIGRRLTHEQLGLESVARDLGMSERTLRRRLRESGQSYRGLLDAVRAERAIALAAERRYTLSAIAQLVGFADQTAFARAFRRWTGYAPQAYLRRGRAP
jgi:AraC-like DNA-binding protein